VAKFLFGFICGVLLATFIALGEAHTDTIPQMRQSVVEVNVIGGMGTGVAIAPNTILTAQHVTQGQKNPTLKFYGSTIEVTGTLKQEWKDLDLALITVPFPKNGHISVVKCDLPLLGDEISTIGFPLGLDWIRTKGNVASDVEDNAMVTDMATNHGNSGGPVFNDKGQVIGIVLAMYSQPSSRGEGSGSPLGVFIPAANFCKQLGINGVK